MFFTSISCSESLEDVHLLAWVPALVPLKWNTSTRQSTMPAALKKCFARPHLQKSTITCLKENGIISVASCAILQEARICTFHPRDKALMHFQYVFQFLGRGAGINKVTICVEQICIGGQYAAVFHGSGCHDAGAIS